MARDKGKWTQTPLGPYYSGKLLLPSFGIEVDGIEVTKSAPRTEVFPEGDGIEDLICDSGDAFSISYLGPQSEATTVDRPFMGLDQACIRRVLLRVLDGEEYDDILLHYTTHYPREVKPGVPKGKPLDLRDLRERRSGSEGPCKRRILAGQHVPAFDFRLSPDFRAN